MTPASADTQPDDDDLQNPVRSLKTVGCCALSGFIMGSLKHMLNREGKKKKKSSFLLRTVLGSARAYPAYQSLIQYTCVYVSP